MSNDIEYIVYDGKNKCYWYKGLYIKVSPDDKKYYALYVNSDNCLGDKFMTLNMASIVADKWLEEKNKPKLTLIKGGLYGND